MPRFTPKRLQKMLPDWAKPFATVKIGDTTYSDTEIHKISISYGKSSVGVALEIPTATVTIFGKLPITYSQPFSVKVTAFQTPTDPRNTRFTGRVGKMEVEDRGSYFITTVYAVADSIRVFRSKESIYCGAGYGLGQIAAQTRKAASKLGITNYGGVVSQHMLESDTSQRVSETIDIPELISRFETHNISILHRRNGNVVFKHPADRVKEFVEETTAAVPVRRKHAFAPAKHEQTISYMDAKIILQMYKSNSKEPARTPVFDRYYNLLPEQPPLTEVVELEPFNIDGDLWSYILRSRIYQSTYLTLVTPSVTVDLLTLLHLGFTKNQWYEWQIYGEILNQEEGDFTVLGIDWPDDLQGAKVTQGWTEEITADSWQIQLSLADPRMTFGFAKWDEYKPPQLLSYTWHDGRPFSDQGKNYAAATWETLDKNLTWRDSQRGY